MNGPLMLALRATNAANSSGTVGVTRSANGSTWSTPVSLINNATTNDGPAMTQFMGRLYVGFSMVDATNNQYISVTSSTDDYTWQANPTVVCKTQVGSAPDMAAFQGKLYVSYRTTGNTLALTSSYNGVTWPASGSVINNIQMVARPGMTVFKGKLYIAYCNTGNIPTVISSSDGVAWGSPVAASSTTMNNSPSLCIFKGKLYLAFQSLTDNTLVIASSADGVKWTSKSLANTVIGGAPELCDYHGKLWAMFRSAKATQALGQVFSVDGGFWNPPVYTTGVTVYSGPGGSQGLAVIGPTNVDHPPSASTGLLLSQTGYLSLGQPAGLAKATSLTAEIWVTVSTVATSFTALSITGSGASFTIEVNKGIPTATATIAGKTYTVTAPNAVAAGNWTCIAFTYDSTSTELVLYTQGVEADAEPNTAANSGSATYTVDVGPTSKASGLTLQGEIGRLLIWSAARSAEDVMGDCASSGVLDPVAETNLQVYIDFSLAPVVDQSGLATPIQYIGGSQLAVTVPGLYLDGASYVKAGTASQLNFSGNASFTIDGWFYPLSYAPSGTQMLVSRTVTGATQYQIAYIASGSSSGTVRFTWGSSSISSASLLADRWYHFAAEYDSSAKALYLYINGNLQASLIVTGSAPAAAAITMIGASGNGGAAGSYFLGSIQGVRFWKDALDQNEVREWLLSQPVLDERLSAAYDFSVSPPVDTTNQTSLTLMGGASVLRQFALVEPGSPVALVGARNSLDAAYENQTPAVADPAPPYAPATPATATLSISDSPFKLRQASDLWSEAYREIYWQAFVERLPADISEKRLSRLRKRFEAGFAKAEQMVRDNPRLANPVSQTLSDGIVRVIYHAQDGDVVLFQGPATEVTSCQIWWISFVATIIFGLINIVLLLNIGQTLTGEVATRLYNLFVRNSKVLSALYELIADLQSGAGAAAVFAFLAVVVSQGLLWSVLKLVLPSLGWWALGGALAKMIAWLASIEASAAITLASVIVWVAQISNAAMNYNASCSINTRVEGNEPATCCPLV